MAALLIYSAASYIRVSVQGAAEAAQQSKNGLVRVQAVKQNMAAISSQIAFAKSGLLAYKSFPNILVQAQSLFIWGEVCIVYFEDISTAIGDKEIEELTSGEFEKAERAVRRMAKKLPEALKNIRSAEEALMQAALTKREKSWPARCWRRFRLNRVTD